MIQLIEKVAAELKLSAPQVLNTVKLLFEEDCTIPFVARYRKEMTGSMDEVALRNVRDRYHYLSELETSKAKYLKVVEEHCQKNPAFKGKFEDLKRRFEACATRQELDDLYLPFKPKRRTRAMVAKEKGLEPLLERILEARGTLKDLTALAAEFVTPPGKDVATELKVEDPEAALAGAADILAERINETAELRALVRQISIETACLVAKKVEEKVTEVKRVDASVEPGVSPSVSGLKPGDPGMKSAKKGGDAAKYENYFDYKEPLKTAPSHRIMAVRRGEAEKVLRVSVEVDDGRAVHELKTRFLGDRIATDQVKAWLGTVVDDAYKRLMGPSIETELRLMSKQVAEDEAITVFSKNLENLLLLPPIPGKTVMGVDPGIRTGSKLAVVDDTGKLLASATIYPDYRHDDHPKTKEAKAVIAGLIDKHKVQCIACGNGTGGREIDKFITGVLREFSVKDVKRAVVNEAGASVYSTEDIAREEFPDLDPTIRSTVSIARRLQDPLAELVKINPRSIGVGQYQHDLNPAKLGKSLEDVVESCVNKVGVNLNTASYALLGYVSGVGPQLAKSIVTHRNNHGRFSSRDDLLKVAGLGPKAFQQAAGFIRVPESEHPLDNSGVHPERYAIVEAIAQDLKKPLREIVGRRDVVDGIPWERYVSDAVGMPTLKDIAQELIKPGRDPREDGARLLFSDEVTELTDLRPGMNLKGTVTNVTNFGAFVDIGVHQDGLVHISELSDQYVKDPASVVAVGMVLNVRVLEVDVPRKRISLSCKTPSAERQAAAPQQSQSRSPRQGPPQGQGGSRDQGRHGGGGQQRPHGGGGGPRPPKKPEPSATINDLLAKFNKR